MISCNDKTMFYGPVMWVFELISKAYGIDIIGDKSFNVDIGIEENDHIIVSKSFFHDIIEHRKFAFITSRKIGNAVIRNKCKRRIRELVRLNQNRLNELLDIVFIVKKKMTYLSYNEINSKIIKLLKDNKLYNDTKINN